MIVPLIMLVCKLELSRHPPKLTVTTCATFSLPLQLPSDSEYSMAVAHTVAPKLHRDCSRGRPPPAEEESGAS